MTGMLHALRGFLETRVDRDGQAAMLEAAADPAAIETGGTGRRDRRLAVPRELLDQALAQKVLHGWLQNRHQTLVPLTFRLDRLPAADAELVVGFAAACLLAATDAVEDRRSDVERWLGGAGAGEATLAAFRAALAAPRPFSTLLVELRAPSLGPYAYAAAVVAADIRDPAGRLLAGFVAARLGLPADAVRSVDRRFRR